MTRSKTRIAGFFKPSFNIFLSSEEANQSSTPLDSSSGAARKATQGKNSSKIQHSSPCEVPCENDTTTSLPVEQNGRSADLAWLKKQTRRLEDLVQAYEKHLSVDTLAALIYPSLALARVPRPYHKTGWLSKLVGRVKKTWRRRLFLLKDDFLLSYTSRDSSSPDHILRLYKGIPIRAVELSLTPFKEIRKDSGSSNTGPIHQSQYYPYCLEIPLSDTRTQAPSGKCLILSAEAEGIQRDWFYSMKKAAATPWYKDTSHGYFCKK